MADDAVARAAAMFAYQVQQDQEFQGLSSDHTAQAAAMFAWQQHLQEQAMQQQPFAQSKSLQSHYMEESAQAAALMAYQQETTHPQTPSQAGHESQSIGAEEAAQAAALLAFQMQQNLQHQQQLLHSDRQNEICLRPGSELDSPLMNHSEGMLMDQLLDHGSQEQQSMILQELMARNTDPVTAQQLLQILEQHKHQQSISCVRTEQTHQKRPEKHYLTISQDGKS
jgi:hypothetical protein